MHELAIGDRVMTYDVHTGHLYYDDIISFLHRSETGGAHFVHIQLDGGDIISLTARHLIYTVSGHQDTLELKQLVPRFAESVKPGDLVAFVNGSDVNSHVSLRRINAVSQTMADYGLYAPLTTSGNIVVNSIVTSCYAQVNSHRIAHWTMTPLRVIHAASKYLAVDLQWDVYNEHGVHIYGDLLSSFAIYAVPGLFRAS